MMWDREKAKIAMKFRKKRPVNAPKLTLALNALWKMKMKNMTGKPQLKNIIKR